MNDLASMQVTVRPSRIQVTDASPSLSYRIFVDGSPGTAPWVEMAFASSPDLLDPEGRASRTSQNFFSTRVLGRLPAKRGEALFVLPPWALARIAGEHRLYHGIALYQQAQGGAPMAVSAPGQSALYVDLSGFTGATVRRAFGAPNPRGGLIDYLQHNGAAEQALTWAGDAPRPGTESTPQGPDPAADRSSAGGPTAAPPTIQPSAAPAADRPPETPVAAGMSSKHQMGSRAMQRPAPGILHQSNYRNGPAGQPAMPSSADHQPPPRPGASPPMPAPNATAQSAAHAYRPEDYDDGYYPPMAAQQGLSEWITSTVLGSVIAEIIGFFRRARERRESFVVGVPTTSFFPFSAICHISGAGGSGTGFYIASDKILTAAHVVAGETQMTITAGKNGYSDSGLAQFTVSSSDWSMHNLYVPGQAAYDMAVIRVSTPPPNGAHFQLINYSPVADTPLAVCGYGATCDNISLDGHKQNIDVGRLGNLHANLEAMGVSVLACHGHSGSPAFVEGPYMSGDNDPSIIPVMGILVSGSTDIDNNICLLTPDKIDWANAGGLYSAQQSYQPGYLHGHQQGYPQQGHAPPGYQPHGYQQAHPAQAPYAAPAHHMPQGRYDQPAVQGPAAYGYAAPYPVRAMEGGDTLQARSLGDLINEILGKFRAVAERVESFVVGVPDTSFFPFSSICHLELNFGGQTYIGTGFYVTPDRILTVGHNLYDRSSGLEADSVRVRAGRNGSSHLSDFTVTKGMWQVHDSYKTNGGPDHDLGIIFTNTQPPGGTDFDLINYSPVPDTPVAICGHGMRNFKNQQVLDSTKQHLDIGLIGSLLPSGEAMQMKIFAMKGHSGSPCFVDGGLTSGGNDTSAMPVMGVLSQIDVTNQGYICLLTPDKIQWAMGQSLPEYAGGMAYATPYGAPPTWAPIVASLVGTATTAGIAGLNSSSGDIAWSVQKMDGWVKPGEHPTPTVPVPPASIQTREIGLESPVYDGTLGEIYAHFRLRYGYDGAGLGKIVVDPAPYAISDPVGKGLKVRMLIEPLTTTFPAQGNPSQQVAAVRVTMHYEYEHTFSSSTFVQYIFTLYGDGTYESTIDNRVGPLANISVDYAPGHPFKR